MKNQLFILLSGLIFIGSVNGQSTFNLTDTLFEKNQIYVWSGFNNFDDTFYGEFYKNRGARIDSIIAFMNANDSLVIEVGFHTPTTGSADFNLRLSKTKSKDFIRVLKKHGLGEISLTSVGYGESQPILTDEELSKIPAHQDRYSTNVKKNGRIVLKIIETKNPQH